MVVSFLAPYTSAGSSVSLVMSLTEFMVIALCPCMYSWWHVPAKFVSIWLFQIFVEAPLLGQAAEERPVRGRRCRAGTMRATAAGLVDRLMADPLLAARARSKQGIVVEYGCWFAGCNGISTALKFFSEELEARHGVKFHFSCLYTVEKDEHCRQMIMRMPEDVRPRCVFGDAAELLAASGRAMDYISGDTVDIPSVGFLVGGFDCGTVSQLNSQRKRQRSQCVGTGTGKTGKTFSMWQRFAYKHKDSL